MEVFGHLFISKWPEIVLGFVLLAIQPQYWSFGPKNVGFWQGPLHFSVIASDTSLPRIWNRPIIKEETLLLTELICKTIHHHLVGICVNQVNVMFFSDHSVCISKHTKCGWTNMYKNCINTKQTNQPPRNACVHTHKAVAELVFLVCEKVKRSGLDWLKP